MEKKETKLEQIEWFERWTKLEQIKWIERQTRLKNRLRG